MDIRRNTFAGSELKQWLVWLFSQVNFVVTSQRNKWFLSSVLFFGLGCALYFLLPARIGVSEIAVAVILLLSAFWMARRFAMLAFALQLAASLMAGALISAVHMELGPKSILTKTLYSTEIEGTVTNLEPRGSRLRVTLQPSRIDGLSPDQLVWKVRLSFLGDAEFAIGDQVRVRARLFPLRPPSVPGDPDFARNLYFSGIGATGFAFGRQFEVLKSVSSFERNDLWSFVQRMRQSVSKSIDQYLSMPEAGIAKALIIGERGEVTPEIAEDLRKSGLAHLLAISGLHMGLLCGTVFFLVRLGFAALPFIALRYPVKKWAAVIAALAGLIYLGLSGATVPTQRAFVMLLVVWVALLLDRRAISLRLAGVAAVAVLVLRPDAILGASFQLSFAAVGALVAFYEGPGRRWLDRRGMHPWYERVFFYVVGLLITGVIVTAVTAPIIGFHFGRISMLGVFANLIAIPVMAFWVMPLIVLALALMPVGLAGWVLALMKPGLSLLIETAAMVAAQEWGLWYVSGLGFG
ncbi:MAG: ComEC/Rec2 family competence protein, partial [Limnobacter sp.]